ncbi:hypothetical protein RHSP_20207 [Rhizobium freirei PRF 81]|uniref:Uncharacterized protein n=1 Tax=Rhizobium freirei PRF 81 TaxID=363754 RepID=N6V5L5_9HYPH|nr:hypothetical protein RHSP_20207 [Rhizobium freirei PRF 81]
MPCESDARRRRSRSPGAEARSAPGRDHSAAVAPERKDRRYIAAARLPAFQPAGRARPYPCAARRMLPSPATGARRRSCSFLDLHSFLESLYQIGALPGKGTVTAGLAAEMAIGRSLGIDRLVEVEMTADAGRREVHVLADSRFDLVLGDALARAVQVDIDRQRLSDADSVGQLDRAAIGKAGSNDVLCEVAGSIGCGTVDLGRVLAGESAAAMRSSTAVGIDDDLAAGQAGIAVRAADDELAGGVDVPLAIGGDLQVAERFDDVGLDNGANLVRIPAIVEMLGGQHDRGHFGRLAVDVADRYLALGVRAKLGNFAFALLAGGSKQLQDPVRIVDRRRHEIRRFLAGVAEHDALVAGTFVALLVGSIVDALGDIGRLRMQEHVDARRLPVEAVLLVADILDGATGSSLELRRIDDVVAVLVLLHQARRKTNFTGDDDAIGGGKGLAGNAHAPRVHAGLCGLAVDQIDDFIRNAVTNFIRVTFGYRLTREQIIRAHVGFPSKNKSPLLIFVSASKNKTNKDINISLYPGRSDKILP